MKLQEKAKAVKLREKGYSYNEIVKIIPVSKGTVSLWLKDIILSPKARERIDGLLTKAQRKSVEINRAKTVLKNKQAAEKASETMKNFYANMSLQRIFCALLYWCEGDKSLNRVSFINSDPVMMKMFLSLFRNGFDLDESKFRVCVHLHSYHNKKEMLSFWSTVTEIPMTQFTKPHMKQTSGMYKKDGYPGCASVYYFDTQTARELLALKNEFVKKMGL